MEPAIDVTTIATFPPKTAQEIRGVSTDPCAPVSDSGYNEDDIPLSVL
jgi:hypothetical protein